MVWELNGHNAFWMILEHVAIAAAWMPLMLLAATLAIRKQSFKWAIATGATVGIAFYSGSLHYVYLSGLVLALCYAVLTVVTARKLLIENKHRAALICLCLPICSLLVAVALSAACWLPMIAWLSSVHRESLGLQAQLSEAVTFKDFAGALIWPQSSSGPAGKGPDFPGFAFTGILAIIISFAALLRRSLPVLMGVIVCVSSLGLALGVGVLVSSFRWALPYFGTLHPHSGFYLFAFAVAVLASFGITEAGSHLARLRLPRYLLSGSGCTLLIVEAWQLIAFAWAINPVQPESPEWLFPETSLIKSVRSLQKDYHVLPVAFRDPNGQWTPPVLAGKVAADFGLQSVSGYESLLPVYTAGLWRTIEQGGNLATNVPASYRPAFFHDRLRLDLLEKVSVGLLVVPPGVKPLNISGSEPTSDGTLQVVYKGNDGWIYKDTRALPRAFLVPQIVAAPDPPTSLKMLIDKTFDARKSAIVIGQQTEAQTALPSDDSQSAKFEATATITNDKLNDVEINALTSRPAMLVLNDSWAPGWKAYVDGIERPVLRVNYAFRGIVVPKGEHRVVFAYRPPKLLIGLIVSGGTLILLLLSWSLIGLQRLYQIRLGFITMVQQGGRARS
jgi:hypothetical protein